MDLVILISLLNASTLTIAVLGFLMFINTPAYRGLCLLFALVSATSIANVFEDLRIFRELYLVSPIFVLGYGPALYLTVKRLVVGPIGYRSAWHFLPMLLLLPFTHYVQPVIAIGTLWRIAYAILTLKLIIEFNRQLSSSRSDASEVSLAWLGWLIVISTLFNALDLLRLNFQPELPHSLNMAGYAGNAFIFLIIYMLLILTLNNKRAGLETLTSATNMATPVLEKPQKKSEESAADYQSLFTILESGLREQRWYTLPRLTLNQLSELSGMAPRDISRCINLVAGMSFNDYINHHRIEQVKNTLQSGGSINLTDLAFAAGFSSKATFNQSFRKATGMTPSEFRSAANNVRNQASSHVVSSD